MGKMPDSFTKPALLSMLSFCPNVLREQKLTCKSTTFFVRIQEIHKFIANIDCFLGFYYHIKRGGVADPICREFRYIRKNAQYVSTGIF
jgi:hypothetical protein